MIGKEDEFSKHSHLSSIIKEKTIVPGHAKENIYDVIMKSCQKENAHYSDNEFKHDKQFISDDG